MYIFRLFPGNLFTNPVFVGDLNLYLVFNIYMIVCELITVVVLENIFHVIITHLLAFAVKTILMSLCHNYLHLL